VGIQLAHCALPIELERLRAAPSKLPEAGEISDHDLHGWRLTQPPRPRCGYAVRMSHFQTWFLLATLCLGCVNESPVLTGIPQAPLLTNTQPTQPAETETRSRYQKSEAVYVDVRYLGGRPFAQVRDILFEQLGALHSRHTLERKAGELLNFKLGSVQVVNKAVAMIKIPLPRPMRRTEALEVLGFPPYVGGYTIFHREYRLHHEWGFRRIRLKREERGSERVIEVEAWRWLPGDRELGR
jgi:hypothetical protein